MRTLNLYSIRVFMIAAILAVLGLTGVITVGNTAAAEPAVSTGPAAGANAVQLQTSPVYEELLPSSSSSLSQPSAVKDYAGNAFDSFVRLVGNDTKIIIQKRNPQGDLVAQAEVRASGSRKMTGADLFIDGSDIMVRTTAYDLTSPQRINAYEVGKWPGIAVAFPDGVNPALGKGPSTYSPAASEAVPIDYDRIKNDVATEVMNRMRSEFGGNIRQGIEDKVKDALGEGFDPSKYSDPRNKYIQDAAATYLRDRDYEAVTAYCQAHACGGPLALPAPTPTPVKP